MIRSHDYTITQHTRRDARRVGSPLALGAVVLDGAALRGARRGPGKLGPSCSTAQPSRRSARPW
ncbi:hypothetical protein [Polyangium mundeleinium]|uniref:Uncharacterized protein n=1 Tax=Polyangium mundeleinium TaxID=2995306 RepID=A0ABT5EU36_9BACT|nr:hypothetical protein [Polyangium mundeleinium]MDC0745337.1 hypothetical protein [Polyangium mundeleinium]